MHRLRIFSLLIGLVLAAASVSPAAAQQTFKTPEEAADALVAALRAGDRKAVTTVLGPGSAELVSSGDDVADANIRTIFLAAYDIKHQVSTEGAQATLIVGQNEWPFPIPLVQRDGNWRFDTAAGRQEILYRRIGRNELAAMQACLAFVDAQNEYAETNASGTKAYAQRIVSSPGKKDGLYWPAADGQPQSPLGEAVALATAEGYRIGGERAPFHGYYYKILTRQGANAPGGAMDYVVRGQMIGGFALVAWPAQYGNSGVMTFLVSHDGTVYEKDLGTDTRRIAPAMTAFNPNQTWKKVVQEVR